MAETVERLAVLIEANTKQFENAMKRLEKVTQQSMSKSTAAVRSLDATLGKLSGTFVNFARGFLVGAAATFLYELPKAIGDIVNEADKLTKVADKVGLTTDQLQELRYAAKLAGVESNNLDTAMQRFSRRVAEAANGSGELKAILDANNISLRNQDGSMRSQNDILADYADLIKNAGSEQEQLLLAFKAFDTEGAAFVNALRNGSAGLRDAAAEARDLGGVLDEELLRGAAELNDDWTRFTTGLATGWKRFVLAAVDGIDDIITKGRELRGVLDPVGELARETGDMLVKYRKATDVLRGKLTGGDRGSGGGLVTSPGIVNAFGAGFGDGPRTKIPDTAKDKEGERAAKKVQDVIDALKLQQEQLTRTDREQEIYNQLARAGVDINSAAGQQIAALSGAYYDQALAIERARETASFFAETTADAIMSIIPAIQTGNSALDSLLNTLIKAVAQAALLGTGPLANLFGGASGTSGVAGGILGSLFGGFRAGGGPVSSGKGYVVGEKGPEFFMPSSAGRIVPANQNGAGGGMAVVRIVASKEFEAHIEEVSGRVSVQTTGAGLASYDQQSRRKQKLAG